ncbi:MAG: iron-sulfur cluster-binding protein [Betaproteobacteria bacterium]|nr:iron-sulfur cluster-binding protein [Betaproteobacteria bacterium]
MQVLSPQFKPRATLALKDASLQAALGKARGGFVDKRAAAAAELPEFEQLREEAKAIKEHTLDHLDFYLERFEERVKAQGGQVHWARNAEDAQRIVLEICRKANAKTVTKGKSMVSEEVGINEVLEQEGIEVIETDLGEYIIQLAKEPPSHIIAPAVHKTKAQVSELFHAHHSKLGLTKVLTEVADLVNEARQVLRGKFFRADVGITGGNFLVAETGSSIIVTNEGNGDLTQTLARVHIVTSGIERVVPTLDDATTFLRLLARSATGQETETYTTVSSGPRRPGDPDGPEEYHVVLVDNGRSKMLAGRFREMLRCIRCGACMNHCPVYGAIGGHAYGWVYPGPMGSVLTPLFVGLDAAYDLPNACTLNGRCQSVCPVKIPLPDLLRELRHMQHEAKLSPWYQRAALAAWGFVASRPRLYHALTGLAVRALGWLGRGRGRFGYLPLASAWTKGRDLPAPQGKTFQEAWRERRGKSS